MISPVERHSTDRHGGPSREIHRQCVVATTAVDDDLPVIAQNTSRNRDGVGIDNT